MQQEIRFATFNVCNLAPPGVKLYDNLEPLTPEGYDAKANWIAQQLDQLDADVIGFQEIFSQAALRLADRQELAPGAAVVERCLREGHALSRRYAAGHL